MRNQIATDPRLRHPAPRFGAETSFWMRAETHPGERRAVLSPKDTGRLIRAGIDVTVEKSDQRVFAIEDYAAIGCKIVPEGSWRDAPREAVVIGLKALPEAPSRLIHRHIFFGHAYKKQPGAEHLLQRFVSGGGMLFDLETLADPSGRRLVAFGHWAGYVGAALGLLRWAGPMDPLSPTSKVALDQQITSMASAWSPTAFPRVLVVGARGRSGRGACEALSKVGLKPTCWDLQETRVLDRQALLSHDILINTVLATDEIRPFMTGDDLVDRARRLSIVVDVSCDPGSPFNTLPIYDSPTSWEHPARRLHDGPDPLDIIAVDNLPSLLPRESSADFSAGLVPHLLVFGESASPWERCPEAFREACDTNRLS